MPARHVVTSTCRVLDSPLPGLPASLHLLLKIKHPPSPVESHRFLHHALKVCGRTAVTRSGQLRTQSLVTHMEDHLCTTSFYVTCLQNPRRKLVYVLCLQLCDYSFLYTIMEILCPSVGLIHLHLSEIHPVSHANICTATTPLTQLTSTPCM